MIHKIVMKSARKLENSLSRRSEVLDVTREEKVWHLAWTGNPIFEEDFETWANGLVCSELFHMHQRKFFVCMDDFVRGYPDVLTEDEKDSVNIVIHDYGDMEPYDLRGLSHSEAPWKDVRGDLRLLRKTK